MSDTNKTSLEKAFLDFQNLKEHAKKEVLNQLEEKVEEKIMSLINEVESIEEKVDTENENTLDESVEVNIKIDEEGVKVDTSELEEENSLEEEVIDEDEFYEISSEAESYQIDNNMDLQEQDPMGQAPMQQEPMPQEPTQDVEGDAEAQVIDGIKKMISQNVGGQDAGEMGAEEIDIVDDEGMPPAEPQMQQPAQPQPQQPMEEDYDGDEIFEIIDEMNEEEVELSWDDIYDESDDELYEITLDEDGDESFEPELEEMKAMGHGHGIRRTTGRGAGPKVAVDNRSRQAVRESNSQAELKYTAHKEAKFAELQQENKSLKAKIDEQKKEIKKFHESFVELRSQFNEMQTFNAKLAYANKLFANGGFSQKEKLQIAESFDNVKSADDAKKLYNKIISENKLSVKKQNKDIEKPITKAIKGKNSEHNVLYESAEVRRMKKLAGIDKSES